MTLRYFFHAWDWFLMSKPKIYLGASPKCFSICIHKALESGIIFYQEIFQPPNLCQRYTSKIWRAQKDWATGGPGRGARVKGTFRRKMCGKQQCRSCLISCLKSNGLRQQWRLEAASKVESKIESISCVFWPAFRCCANIKDSWNSFSGCFQPFVGR